MHVDATMAPGPRVTNETTTALQSHVTTVDRKVDTKTSGQHSPRYELLQPYDQFPKKVSGPTLWDIKDYKHNPERWVYRFDGTDISELSTAADRFINQERPLVEITKVGSSSEKKAHARSWSNLGAFPTSNACEEAGGNPR